MALSGSLEMGDPFLRFGRLSLVGSLPEHCYQVAENMRRNDIRECWIVKRSPLEALVESLTTKGAKTYTLCLDDTHPIGMCGTVPIDKNLGRIWLLGTDDITNHWRPFLRGCKPTIEFLSRGYRKVENFVPYDHDGTIMWLTWCGFVIEDYFYDIHGHQFIRFEHCVSNQNDGIGELSRPVMH